MWKPVRERSRPNTWSTLRVYFSSNFFCNLDVSKWKFKAYGPRIRPGRSIWTFHWSMLSTSMVFRHRSTVWTTRTCPCCTMSIIDTMSDRRSDVDLSIEYPLEKIRLVFPAINCFSARLKTKNTCEFWKTGPIWVSPKVSHVIKIDSIDWAPFQIDRRAENNPDRPLFQRGLELQRCRGHFARAGPPPGGGEVCGRGVHVPRLHAHGGAGDGRAQLLGRRGLLVRFIDFFWMWFFDFVEQYRRKLEFLCVGLQERNRENDSSHLNEFWIF